MSYLTALKLVTSNKYQTINPIVSKRNKLCAKLFEQIAVVEADMNNESYTVKKLKTFKFSMYASPAIELAEQVISVLGILQ